MRLESMAARQFPAEKIARRLRRSEAAVRAEARKQRVLLAPPERQLALTDKRAYGGIRVEPVRSVARTRAGARPPRAHSRREQRPAQNETLF